MRVPRCQIAALVLAAVVAATLPAAANGGSSPEGIAYLEANKEKEGVVALPSGLQYKVLRKGEGAYHPTVDSPCECHYKGTLIDGTQFDSSYDRGSPTTFAPNQVIGGWTEAMQLMVEGDKWELYIPSDLAYGDQGSPPKIPGGATLVFTIEILTIKGNKVPALTCDSSSGEGCNEKELAFIEKLAAKSLDSDGLQKEIARLQKMKAEPMKDELLNWLERRLRILQQRRDEL